MTFEDRVVAVVSSLRPGEVATYGEVALEAGSPGAARAVGNILSRSGGTLPWWRVVAAGGRLATGKEADQARRLRAEGVPIVNNNRVQNLRSVRSSAGYAPETPHTLQGGVRGRGSGGR